MMTHPDLLMAQVHDHQRQMIAEAERSRLLRGALDRRRRVRNAARQQAKTAASQAVEGNLAGCGERAPAPAQ